MLLITDGWYEVIVLLEHDLGDGSTQLSQMHGRQSCMLWKRMQRRWLWFGQHLTSTVQGTVLWLSTRRMMRERISSRVSILGSHIGCLLAGMDSLEELRDMPRRETVLNSPEPTSPVGGRPTPSAPELVVRLRGTLLFIIRAPTVRYVSFSSFSAFAFISSDLAIFGHVRPGADGVQWFRRRRVVGALADTPLGR